MDDTAATAIMQRFGKSFFSRDRALLANILCEDAKKAEFDPAWVSAYGNSRWIEFTFPWPNRRFDVTHSRREPDALTGPVRFCAGGAS